MKEKINKSKKDNKTKGLILILFSFLMLFSEILFPIGANPFYLIQIFTTIALFGTGLNIVF